MAQDNERRDAAALEAGYASSHRAYETAGILATTGMGVWLLIRILKSAPLSGWWMPLAALLGLLFADFISGFVHWTFDTWGSVDTPVFGQLAIRTFRHHHVDKAAITRHDFIETNGHNFSLALLPATVGALWVRPEEARLVDVFVGLVALSATIFVSLTSQIHKWAHQVSPPWAIRMLQRARLVLSPEHHEAHHGAPYNRNYCITVGWLNGPLRAVRFFETLELLVEGLTGAVPREDDLGKDAAIEVARENTSADEPASGDAVRLRD